MSDKKAPALSPKPALVMQSQLLNHSLRWADSMRSRRRQHICRARRKRPGPMVTDQFLRAVHYDMFGEIWESAGKYRTGPVNIGVDFHLIPEQIKLLCGDFSYWNSAQSSMPPLEIAARLQNRFSRIHPFTNGNGRHPRLITDIVSTPR